MSIPSPELCITHPPATLQCPDGQATISWIQHLTLSCCSGHVSQHVKLQNNDFWWTEVIRAEDRETAGRWIIFEAYVLFPYLHKY